jgi:DNA polymerase-3 subunit alpha (Gram-positive type)
MLIKTKPKNFGELVKVCGFAHGTNVWTDNGEWLLEKGISAFEIPTLRDDIMNDLIRVGVDRLGAFKISDSVRRGMFARGKAGEELTNLFKEFSKPLGDWYFEFCSNVRYIFPKSHAIENVIVSLKIAWFKKYYPKEFYEAYLNCFLCDTENLTEEGQKAN